MKKSKFKEGDLVVHKAGEMAMMITDVNSRDGDTTYDCRWEKDKNFEQSAFYEYELKNMAKKIKHIHNFVVTHKDLEGGKLWRVWLHCSTCGETIEKDYHDIKTEKK